jgi:hypothetical protein
MESIGEHNDDLTQIRLTAAQSQALRRLSATTRKSVAALIREAVNEVPFGRRILDADRTERAIAVSGAFASGGCGASGGHDRYLAEAFLR